MVNTKPNALKQTSFFIILTILTPNYNAYQVDNNPYRHFETLDQDGKFQLEWLVNWEESRVVFNVTVETKGYVGFGLSRKGKMSGADIVIGGVLPNGEPYFSDRHAIGNQVPVKDPSQDWVLYSASESDTKTFLSFSRSFETCDEDHDLPIHDDVIALIWAYGEKYDDLEYHHQNRGIFYSYLLDPDLTPKELANTKRNGTDCVPNTLGHWKVWRIAQELVMPTQDTAYLCKVYKAPPGNRKRHIVGFRSVLPTNQEQRHIHHYIFYRCIPPVGQDASSIFENLSEEQQECYILNQPQGRIPTNYCTDAVHVWAVGQKPIFFPDHVGFPIYPNEYFMLQTHYDNPNKIPGIHLNHALEIFHTENLRKHDAAILAMIGSLIPASPSIMIPPNSLSHKIYGHCGAGCTKSMFPPTGIRAFASLLHTHLAGRGVRRIHIRNNTELPWISYDDNYNFNYQQVRILREERLILPGDTIIEQCTYENTDREGNVTVGGFSTRNEMCSGMLWYYDKIPDRGWCASELRSSIYHNFLQIYNTTWSNNRLENVVTYPPQNEGLLVSEVGNLRMDWTLANRKQLQEYHRYLPQVSICPSLIVDELTTRNQTRAEDWRIKAVAYPEIQDPETEFISVYPRDILRYERPNNCENSQKRNKMTNRIMPNM